MGMLQVQIDQPTVEGMVEELAGINKMETSEFITKCLALHFGIPSAQKDFSGPYLFDAAPSA